MHILDMVNTPEYQEWYINHEEKSTKKSRGLSQKNGGRCDYRNVFKTREMYGMKYDNYIGNGNSKTFKTILDQNPCDDEFQIVKSECIGHVEKRMDTRLQNIKKKLGDKDKLTDALIKKPITYYSLAIRRNVNSIEGMKKSVMTTYYTI